MFTQCHADVHHHASMPAHLEAASDCRETQGTHLHWPTDILIVDLNGSTCTVLYVCFLDLYGDRYMGSGQAHNTHCLVTIY